MNSQISVISCPRCDRTMDLDETGVENPMTGSRSDRFICDEGHIPVVVLSDTERHSASYENRQTIMSSSRWQDGD